MRSASSNHQYHFQASQDTPLKQRRTASSKKESFLNLHLVENWTLNMDVYSVDSLYQYHLSLEPSFQYDTLPERVFFCSEDVSTRNINIDIEWLQDAYDVWQRSTFYSKTWYFIFIYPSTRHDVFAQLSDISTRQDRDSFYSCHINMMFALAYLSTSE